MPMNHVGYGFSTATPAWSRVVACRIGSSVTDDDADLVQEYALALRAYLRAHPRAADTLTGVVMFWLRGRPASRDEVVAVELALEQLVAESLLVKRASGDGHVIYVGAAGPSRKGH